MQGGMPRIIDFPFDLENPAEIVGEIFGMLRIDRLHFPLYKFRVEKWTDKEF